MQLATTTDELKASTEELDAAQQRVTTTRATLKELQTMLATTTDELQALVTDHGKVLRDRETLLGEVRSAKEQLEKVNQAEATVTESVSELRKSLAELQMQEIERATQVKTLEAGIARLRKVLSGLSAASPQVDEAAGTDETGSEAPKPNGAPASGSTEKPESSTEDSQSPPTPDSDGK